jgi:hypothetical protein
MLFNLIVEMSTEDEDKPTGVSGTTVVKLFVFCTIISFDKLKVEGGEVIIRRVGVAPVVGEIPFRS